MSSSTKFGLYWDVPGRVCFLSSSCWLVFSSRKSSLLSSSTGVGFYWDVCGHVCFLSALLVGLSFLLKNHHYCLVQLGLGFIGMSQVVSVFFELFLLAFFAVVVLLCKVEIELVATMS